MGSSLIAVSMASVSAAAAVRRNPAIVDGRTLPALAAAAVVVATEGPAAARLLDIGDRVPEVRGDFTPYWEDAAAPTARAFAGHVAFWLGASIVFLGRNSAAFMGFFPAIMALGIVFSLHVRIERAIVGYPLLTIFCGAFVNTIVWLLLGTDDLLRRYCGEVILVFDSDAAGEMAADRAVGPGGAMGAGPVPLPDDRPASGRPPGPGCAPH